MLTARAVAIAFGIGVLAGLSAVYVELLIRAPVHLLFAALIDWWYVAGILIVASALLVDRAPRWTRRLALVGTLWLGAAIGHFAFVASFCIGCQG